MNRLSAACGLLVLAIAACSDANSTNDDEPSLTVAGQVLSDSGVALEGTSVLLRVFDTTVGGVHASRTILADSAGRFAVVLPIDTLLSSGLFQANILPPIGSGYGSASRFEMVYFDSIGQADLAQLSIIIVRQEPPVPEGPPAALSAAALVGDYSGESVSPITFSGVAYLDLSLTALGDSVHGRYAIDFSASTACGNGAGEVSGNVLNDTVHLKLVSDSFPGWDGTHRVTFMQANTYVISADTLIVTYPENPGDCPWGSPAPLRLMRQ